MNHITLTMLRNWLLWATVHARLPEKFDSSIKNDESSLKITHPNQSFIDTPFLRDFYYRRKIICPGPWIPRLTIIVQFWSKSVIARSWDRSVRLHRCWWQFLGIGDRISILMTSFVCQCQTLGKNGQNRHQYLEVVANRVRRARVPLVCHALRFARNFYN